MSFSLANFLFPSLAFFGEGLEADVEKYFQGNWVMRAAHEDHKSQ